MNKLFFLGFAAIFIIAGCSLHEPRVIIIHDETGEVGDTIDYADELYPNTDELIRNGDFEDGFSPCWKLNQSFTYETLGEVGIVKGFSPMGDEENACLKITVLQSCSGDLFGPGEWAVEQNISTYLNAVGAIIPEGKLYKFQFDIYADEELETDMWGYCGFSPTFLFCDGGFVKDMYYDSWSSLPLEKGKKVTVEKFIPANWIDLKNPEYLVAFAFEKYVGTMPVNIYIDNVSLRVVDFGIADFSVSDQYGMYRGVISKNVYDTGVKACIKPNGEFLSTNGIYGNTIQITVPANADIRNLASVFTLSNPSDSVYYATKIDVDAAGVLNIVAVDGVASLKDFSRPVYIIVYPDQYGDACFIYTVTVHKDVNTPYAMPPSFSIAPGFYEEAFELQLDVDPDQDVEIKYTTDGRDPRIYGIEYHPGDTFTVSDFLIVRAFSYGATFKDSDEVRGEYAVYKSYKQSLEYENIIIKPIGGNFYRTDNSQNYQSLLLGKEGTFSLFPEYSESFFTAKGVGRYVLNYCSSKWGYSIFDTATSRYVIKKQPAVVADEMIEGAFLDGSAICMLNAYVAPASVRLQSSFDSFSTIKDTTVEVLDPFSTVAVYDARGINKNSIFICYHKTNASEDLIKLAYSADQGATFTFPKIIDVNSVSGLTVTTSRLVVTTDFVCMFIHTNFGLYCYRAPHGDPGNGSLTLITADISSENASFFPAVKKDGTILIMRISADTKKICLLCSADNGLTWTQNTIFQVSGPWNYFSLIENFEVLDEKIMQEKPEPLVIQFRENIMGQGQVPYFALSVDDGATWGQ